MNPRVGPTSKNVGLFQGKVVVFPELNGEIPSLIKDGEKSVTANYDLSLLDVVPVKSISSKTKHVHFLPEKASVSPTKCKVQHGNSTKRFFTEKRDTTPMFSCSRKGAKELTSSQSSSSSCGSIQIDNDTSEATEVSSTTPAGKRTSARRNSSPKFQKTATAHRSHSLASDETQRAHSVDNDYQNSKSAAKESVHYEKQRTNRSLPSTPAKATKTSSSPQSTRETRPSKHKSPTESKKNILSNPTVRFADHVSSSHNHQSKSRSNNEFNTKSSMTKENAKQNCVISEKETPSKDSSGNLTNIFKSSLPIRRKQSPQEDSFRQVKLEESTKFTNDSKSDQRTRTKIVISNETKVPPMNHFIGWQSRFDQSKRDSNYLNTYLTNPDASSNLSSTSLKCADQPKTDSWHEMTNGIQSLTPPVLSSSSNKDLKSINMYDLSSVLSTVFSKLPRDETLSADLKQMSASTSGSLTSTAAPTFKLKPKRSLSCLEKDCIYRNGLDFIIAANFAKNDEKSAHSSSPGLHGKHRDATLSDLEPNPSSTLVKKFGQSLLPISNTKYKNSTSVMKKESIAASYQLDYCWFCGRPMPTFGISGSSQDDLLQKLAELERLLAECETEKLKLLEEQVKLRNSKMLALQKNEALEKELEQIKLKENKVQEETTRPLTSTLPNTNKDFDLRAHLEHSGHQLDICPHILVSRHSCRGILHKMGGRFRMLKKRWFVLDMTKRMVLYFTDKTETKLKGSFSVQAIDEVYVDHLWIVKSPSPKLTFCVKTRERTYQFVAPSSDTMTIWVDALFSAAEGYQRMFDSGHEAFVDK